MREEEEPDVEDEEADKDDLMSELLLDIYCNEYCFSFLDMKSTFLHCSLCFMIFKEYSEFP